MRKSYRPDKQTPEFRAAMRHLALAVWRARRAASPAEPAAEARDRAHCRKASGPSLAAARAALSPAERRIYARLAQSHAEREESTDA